MSILVTPDGLNISTWKDGLGKASLSVDVEQIRPTFRASTIGVVSLANVTGPFFTLIGSASKTVRLRRLFFTGTIAAAAANVIILLSKRSAAYTSGTASAMTALPVDANDAAATAVASAYTAAPTPGALVGTLEVRRALLAVTGAVATPEVLFDFTRGEAKPPVLRGVAQGLDLSFQTAPGNVVAGSIWAEWTEE